MNRRQFIQNSSTLLAATGLGLLAQSSAQAASSENSPASAQTQPPLRPQNGQQYHPVITLNGGSLPYTMVDGVKEFRLSAEAVSREFAPGMTVKCWGYNGTSPGPTIEAVEGDRIRVFVTNRLPERTSVHWHGLLLPNGMDGVAGLTQPHIPVGKTAVYEFTLRQNGTFMYHPHSDEMVQMAMGMMGLFIIHPKNPNEHRVDRDFAFLVQSWDIDPGTSVPNPATMTDFNLWSFNSRTFPAIDPLVVRTGDKVRIRIGNLSMTNHPIHLHGVTFKVTGTDGGWIPPSAQWPEVTVDIPVGGMRVIEFTPHLAGDWALHCHKAHHTMGPMGHKVPNMLGTQQDDATIEKISQLLPDYMYMPMGENGGGDMQGMAEMGMALPANTLPMMTGDGPFGAIEMGGMFTILKVRDQQAAGDYTDPGWYSHPAGSVVRIID